LKNYPDIHISEAGMQYFLNINVRWRHGSDEKYVQR
jgi:hypothetical protein